MARDDWFRNTSWDADIEAAFHERLRRARDKPQYLRLQAWHLRESHPRAALALLDQYFALGDDHFDAAQAHVDRGCALRALGDTQGALSSYEAALAREALSPGTRTQAYLDLPCLVAEARVTHLYLRALEVLDAHRGQAIFPVEHYRVNGARALLLRELGRIEEARAAARLAMAAAGEGKSGFHHHPTLGLVERTDDDFGRRVAALAGG